MALQSSGPISLANVNVEFNRAATTQASMSQLYRGGGIVTTNNTAVPTSGPISLSQFYSARREFAFTIGGNLNNANLRTLAVNAGWDQQAPVVATVGSGVYIGSTSVATPALVVNGSFPAGVQLINNGFVVGMGGSGSNAAVVNVYQSGSNQYGPTYAYNIVAASAAGSGGAALAASVPITITNNGTIGGGGGGGGSGAIGGGPGYTGGGGGGGGRSFNNSSAGSGTYRTGAAEYAVYNGGAGGVGSSGSAGGGGPAGADGYGRYGGVGGAGGSWGASGSSGANSWNLPSQVSNPTGGGGGGAAVTGNSNITWAATGTRLGAIT